MTHQLRWRRILDVLAYAVLVINIVAVPLWVDTRLLNGYVLPKQYLFISLVLVNVLIWSIRLIVGRKITYIRSALRWPLLFFWAALTLGTLFSVSSYTSWFGRGDYFTLNFSLLFFLGIWFFLLLYYLKTAARWQGIYDAIVISGGITALLFLLRAVFHISSIETWLGPMWNTVDTINSVFGLWLLIIFILSAGYLIKKEVASGRLLLYGFTTIVSFACLVLLSFTILWWLLLVSLLLLLVMGIRFLREARVVWLSTLFSFLIVVALLLIFGAPKAWQAAVPAEVSLGVKSSWTIVNKTITKGVKNFLLGSGPGTFSADFSQWREVSFNNDPVAWSIRFNAPQNSLFAMLAEDGILLVIVLIGIVLIAMGYLWSAFKKSSILANQEGLVGTLVAKISGLSIEIFVVAIAWLLITISLALMIYGTVLWWMWWLLLAVLVSGLAFKNESLVRREEIILANTPEYNLSFSFVMIVVIAAVILAGVWEARWYGAEYNYAAAIKISDYTVAKEKLKLAIASHNHEDRYHVALAQVYLREAGEKSRAGKPDMPIIGDLVTQAVTEARAATTLSPNSVAIWENLALMYENAALLVPEAGSWAITTLSRAQELEPTNPVIAWRLGNSYSAERKWPEAIKSYEQSIALKSNYSIAYIDLATAHEGNNNPEKAIETYQKALSINHQPEVLFNLGRLLYNRNEKDDRANAEALWLEAVRLQPTYANALYSLGLLYEARADKAAALQYYYKVKDLNTDNKEITAKIKALMGR